LNSPIAVFSRRINARPTSYYAEGGVEAAIAAAVADASADKAYQFIARNAAQELVARVNLTRVRREHFHSAELGYRVAETHNGKGYASEAVRVALGFAFDEMGLHRVEATARVGNPASAKVLLRHGFREFGRSTRSFQLANAWHDLQHFELHAGRE
jgi:[ribosomal protein S5]-alanine N-acetyltransferase